jgi:hypothetical protein
MIRTMQDHMLNQIAALMSAGGLTPVVWNYDSAGTIYALDGNITRFEVRYEFYRDHVRFALYGPAIDELGLDVDDNSGVRWNRVSCAMEVETVIYSVNPDLFHTVLTLVEDASPPPVNEAGGDYLIVGLYEGEGGQWATTARAASPELAVARAKDELAGGDDLDRGNMAVAAVIDRETGLVVA